MILKVPSIQTILWFYPKQSDPVSRGLASTSPPLWMPQASHPFSGAFKGSPTCLKQAENFWLYRSAQWLLERQHQESSCCCLIAENNKIKGDEEWVREEGTWQKIPENNPTNVLRWLSWLKALSVCILHPASNDRTNSIIVCQPAQAKPCSSVLIHSFFLLQSATPRSWIAPLLLRVLLVALVQTHPSLRAPLCPRLFAGGLLHSVAPGHLVTGGTEHCRDAALPNNALKQTVLLFVQHLKWKWTRYTHFMQQWPLSFPFLHSIVIFDKKHCHLRVKTSADCSYAIQITTCSVLLKCRVSN